MATSSRWKPIRWSPSIKGILDPKDDRYIRIPVETGVGFVSGILGGMIATKPAAESMHINPTALTAGFAAASFLAPIIAGKIMSPWLSGLLYGLGAGLLGSAVIQYVEPILSPKQVAPTPAATPTR